MREGKGFTSSISDSLAFNSLYFVLYFASSGVVERVSRRVRLKNGDDSRVELPA